jgi:hypothetical protein
LGEDAELEDWDGVEELEALEDLTFLAAFTLGFLYQLIIITTSKKRIARTTK